MKDDGPLQARPRLTPFLHTERARITQSYDESQVGVSRKLRRLEVAREARVAIREGEPIDSPRLAA